jgi:hypothetical protein
MKIIKIDKCLHCPYFLDIWNYQCRYNGCKIIDPYKENISNGCGLNDEHENEKNKNLRKGEN